MNMNNLGLAAERLVQMPWWEWRDGMAWIVDRSGGPWPSDCGRVPDDGTRTFAVPVLDDPATQGVLLAWCRELEPTVHIRMRIGCARPRWVCGYQRVVSRVGRASSWRWAPIASSADYGEAIALGLIALQEGKL